MSLHLGDIAPNFSATTTEGAIEFHHWLGNSWGVLLSHPADFTPVCTTELGAVARIKAEFEKRNVKVIAVSLDPLESHNGWIRDINETQAVTMNFPVIADESGQVATAYDMIHPNADRNATVRTVFVIGPDKRVKLTLAYPDSTGRNFDELLRVIDSLQLTATHRVATPADWQQGRECIVAPEVSDTDAERLFPRGVRKLKPYLRYTPQPSLNPNRALWEKGDFTRIAETMRESAEAFVRRLGITRGLKVLDLGCGDGTTALPAAKLGAEVLGVDIARNLVEAGRRRAKEQGLTNCKFQEGDATHLHELKDQAFDVVVSVFGAMFAPKPFDVAREMVRVTRPGGRIIMGNWIPGDPTMVAQLLKISSAHTPPPPAGFISPMTWGIESHVIERFAAAGVPKENISFVRDTFTFSFPGAPSEFVAAFRKYYGPTMNAFEAAEKNGRAAELQKELEELFALENRSPRNGATSIPATFLRVTVALKDGVSPFQVPNDGGREVNVLGIPMVIRIHGRETGSGVSVVESHDVPGGGPPPHIHHREDETFQVLEGEYEWTVGGKTFLAQKGATIYAPRGIPHTYRYLGQTPGRLMCVITPAGFEGFFEEIGALSPQQQQEIPRVIEIGRKYGLEFPPPGA